MYIELWTKIHIHESLFDRVIAIDRSCYIKRMNVSIFDFLVGFIANDHLFIANYLHLLDNLYFVNTDKQKYCELWYLYYFLNESMRK